MPITKNIKTDYGALGDGVVVTALFALANSGPGGVGVLTCTTNQWVAGDAGKVIVIPAGDSNTNNVSFHAIIATFDSATQVTLDRAAATTFGSSSQTVGWASDDTTPFQTFRTDAIADGTATLTIPAGIYILLTENAPFGSIPTLTVNATGATFLWSNGNMFLTGPVGFPITGQITSFEALVQDVPVGQNYVICKTAADATSFPTGRWVALTALAFQAGSYPPNVQYCQYGTVTGTNGTTGRVDLDFTTTDSYSSLYPNYVVHEGGPATLFLMGGKTSVGMTDTGWDTTTVINGLTMLRIDSTVFEQCNIVGRSVTLNNMTFTSVAPNPTQAKYVQFNTCTVTGSMIELDKCIDTLEFVSCSMRSLLSQSTSVQNVLVSATTFSTFWHGTPRRLVVQSNSSLPDFFIGPTAYGMTESVILRDSEFPNGVSPTIVFYEPTTNFSQSGGDLTYIGPNELRFGPPGALFFLAGSSRPSGNHIAVSTGITTSGASVILHTNFVNPIPSLPNPPMGAATRIMEHPCKSFTQTNCTYAGVLQADPPPRLPLMSYLKTTQSFSTAQFLSIWGKLVSIRINVLSAGSAPCTFHLGQFDNVPILNPDGTGGTYGPTVDASITGERFITPTAITGSRGGDALGVAPGTIWFTDLVTPTTTISGSSPSILLEILADQLPPSTTTPTPIWVDNTVHGHGYGRGKH